MVLRSADANHAGSLAARMRRRRVQLFLDLIPRTGRRIRILDLGGTSWSWRQLRVDLPAGCEVTLVNLQAEPDPGLPGFVSVAGDARSLPQYRAGEFDLGFSNSVIEHVGTLADQVAMAGEIRRVCRGYFVQTPNRYFLLEPHFLVPGWQYLPIWLRRRWLQARDVGWVKRVPDPLRAQAEIEQIRLLSGRELQWLFPDGRIYRERVGPFTKSLVAWKRPEDGLVEVGKVGETHSVDFSV